MEERKQILRLTFKHSRETFALTIICLAITGLAVGDAVPDVGMFAVGYAGLSYHVIVQVFAWSWLVGVLITLFASDLFFKKTMMLWRRAILLFLGIASAAVFAFVFEWFPRDTWVPWVVFLAVFGLCFGIGLFAMCIKTKHEDRKYEKLLSDYKANQKNDDMEESA